MLFMLSPKQLECCVKSEFYLQYKDRIEFILSEMDRLLHNNNLGHCICRNCKNN